MAKKRTPKKIPNRISPFVWGYITMLKKKGIPLQDVYLFGSWAKGNAHKDSDIDIAIISPTFSTWKRTNKALMSVITADFYSIEPHGFHPKEFVDENPVVHEIKQHGIRIL